MFENTLRSSEAIAASAKRATAKVPKGRIVTVSSINPATTAIQAPVPKERRKKAINKKETTSGGLAPPIEKGDKAHSRANTIIKIKVKKIQLMAKAKQIPHV